MEQGWAKGDRESSACLQEFCLMGDAERHQQVSTTQGDRSNGGGVLGRGHEHEGSSDPVLLRQRGGGRGWLPGRNDSGSEFYRQETYAAP